VPIIAVGQLAAGFDVLPFSELPANVAGRRSARIWAEIVIFEVVLSSSLNKTVKEFGTEQKLRGASNFFAVIKKVWWWKLFCSAAKNCCVSVHDSKKHTSQEQTNETHSNETRNFRIRGGNDAGSFGPALGTGNGRFHGNLLSGLDFGSVIGSQFSDYQWYSRRAARRLSR
jgi:hypothetical protein